MQVKITLLLLVIGSALADPLFEKYQKDFSKSYTNKNYAQRKAIFQENVRKISEHNEKYARGEVSYSMGINEFTDMSEQEFEAYANGLPAIPESTDNEASSEEKMKTLMDKYENYNFRESFSWVDQGVVTSVKDQGQCGSCTAFACTAAIESCFAIKSGNVFDDLSEQFLVDCANGYTSGEFGAYGCSGAWPQAYMAYIPEQHAGKHQMESAYPYTAQNGDCTAEDAGYYTGGTMTGSINLYDTNEDRLKELLVEHGPVVTTFNANPLQFYNGGIFEDHRCCDSLTEHHHGTCGNHNNHAVLVVGYGSEGGLDYWLVKNSWGDWGESGYFRIKRGTGHCGFGWQVNSVPLC